MLEFPESLLAKGTVLSPTEVAALPVPEMDESYTYLADAPANLQHCTKYLLEQPNAETSVLRRQHFEMIIAAAWLGNTPAMLDVDVAVLKMEGVLVIACRDHVEGEGGFPSHGNTPPEMSHLPGSEVIRSY